MMVVGSGDPEATFSSFLVEGFSRGRRGPSPGIQEHVISQALSVDRPTPQMRPTTTTTGAMVCTGSGAGIQDTLPDVTQGEGSASHDRAVMEEAEQAAPCWHEVVVNIVTNPCTGV